MHSSSSGHLLLVPPAIQLSTSVPPIHDIEAQKHLDFWLPQRHYQRHRLQSTGRVVFCPVTEIALRLQCNGSQDACYHVIHVKTPSEP